MKVNAPEKIYIHPDIGGKEFLRPWLHRAANSESVEYVRKDAFIEKACDFLKDRIEHDSIDYPMATNRLIEDFKKYMKGE